MNLINEAHKFAELSVRYRKAYDEKVRATALAEIRALIDENAQRIALNFKVELDKRKSGFDRRRGMPIFSLSLPRMIAKKGYVQMRDITTYNVRKEQKITGCNMMLDYSGSMWFDSEHTIGDVLRIHCQNFYALCLIRYLQGLSRNDMKIVVTAFSMTPVCIFNSTTLEGADIDGFLVSNEWGSFRHPPKFMRSLDIREWCNNVYPREAFTSSYAHFVKENYKNFLTVLITDGGMHRLGESSNDRLEFLKKALTSIKSEEQVVFVTLIKTQDSIAMNQTSIKGFIDLLKELQIPYSEMNEPDEYDQSFDYLANFINTMVGV
jgi:hypothetical protein